MTGLKSPVILVSRLLLMTGIHPPEDFADEGLTGDQRFLDILTLYTERHAGGSVTSADLQRAAEDLMGQDMTWFFDPWLNGLAYPALE